MPFALWVVTKPACPLPRAFTTLCYSADGQSILAGGMSKFVCIYHVREQILRKKFEISCNLSLDAMEVSEVRGCCRAPWSPELSGLTWRPPHTLAPQATWGPSRQACLPGFTCPGLVLGEGLICAAAAHPSELSGPGCPHCPRTGQGKWQQRLPTCTALAGHAHPQTLSYKNPPSSGLTVGPGLSCLGLPGSRLGSRQDWAPCW